MLMHNFKANSQWIRMREILIEIGDSAKTLFAPQWLRVIEKLIIIMICLCATEWESIQNNVRLIADKNFVCFWSQWFALCFGWAYVKYVCFSWSGHLLGINKYVALLFIFYAFINEYLSRKYAGKSVWKQAIKLNKLPF